MSTSRAASLPHVRPIQPRRFPAEEPECEKMGQSTRHGRLCMALYQMLAAELVPKHTVGFDNFVYFDASNPERKLAPDAFVKLDVPWHDFESYRVWEEGTPEVAFEILSPSDTPERWTFEEKLRRYHALGVRELVAFDVDAPSGKRLRVWDRLEHDLLERVVERDTTECVTLGLTLLVGPVLVGPEGSLPIALRLARDPEGRDLVLTSAEEQRRVADAERARADTERARADAERAKVVAAEKRIAELEHALAERQRP